MEWLPDEEKWVPERVAAAVNPSAKFERVDRRNYPDQIAAAAAAVVEVPPPPPKRRWRKVFNLTMLDITRY